MEMPTERQITEAGVDSMLRGETEAELMERVDRNGRNGHLSPQS